MGNKMEECDWLLKNLNTIGAELEFLAPLTRHYLTGGDRLTADYKYLNLWKEVVNYFNHFCKKKQIFC